MRSKRKGEDLKMDEDSIVSALQSDLQNYKVKPQIRRKESQLHVLITRAEGDQPDYDSLYDIVKRRIDSFVIDGVDTLVVYGRLAKAKHPEWQKTVEIKPPLPLIEFDLEELDDFGDIGELGSLSIPSEIEDGDIKIGSFDPPMPARFDTFDTFEQSLEKDLQRTSEERDRPKVEDFDLGELDLSEFQLDSFKQSSDFDLGELDTDSFDLEHPVSARQSPNNKNGNGNINGNGNGRSNGNSWRDEDFNLDETTVAMPMPLPPPLPPTKRIVNKPTTEPEPTPQVETVAERQQKSWLISGAFVMVAIAVFGICGWVLVDRSSQQKYLESARRLENQPLNPQKVTNLAELTETRNQLQSAISQLDEIPDRPASLYGEAQSELGNLRPKLADFDRKVELEQVANKKLESAKMTTLEAAKLVQSPPHRSTVWKSAQEKRQQALKLLGEIPPDSLLYPNAQTLLKSYRNELVQISKWVEIQQRSETVAANINPNTVTLLKQLKTKAPEKPKYIAQCKTILQPQIFNIDAQRTGIAIPTLSEYLCAYFWSL
ncbi:hypothetical protein H6F42_11100 [Pseudanabaena sp. FACHB-1998]|uniref:hypothetical protein n=1 Tax=Pseudanabaena sp. FACHB-1998 TaxID=2692858 RepID=UPI0016812D6B|nr:hypothetical protein [Pseudanabaena sp. FACHB-1998]MBD2177459.1 hypothetical protein [Pseudanabaena sp. FACHB-1998]